MGILLLLSRIRDNKSYTEKYLIPIFEKSP